LFGHGGEIIRAELIGRQRIVFETASAGESDDQVKIRPSVS
jgi:hypothetical protein